MSRLSVSKYVLFVIDFVTFSQNKKRLSIVLVFDGCILYINNVWEVSIDETKNKDHSGVTERPLQGPTML